MSLEELIPILGELVNKLKKIPTIDQGKEYFVSKGWKTVEFNEQFEEPPVVSVKFESPEGWPGDLFPFAPPDIKLDKIATVAMAKLKEFDFVIDFPDPLAEGKSYPDWLADKLVEAAETYLKKDSFTATIATWFLDFTKIKANVKDMVHRVGERIGYLIETYVFGYIKERLQDFRDKIKAKLNEILEDIRGKVKDAFSDFKDKIQKVLNPFQDDIQDGFNILARFSCDAFNLSLDRYYESMGLQKEFLAIPVMIKQGSVTCTEFEVWSPVGTLHWRAMGSPPMVGQPIIRQLETIIETRG